MVRSGVAMLSRVGWLVLALPCGGVWAQLPPAPPPPEAAAGGVTVTGAKPAGSANGSSSEHLQEFITTLVREHIPTEFEEKKRWGQTIPVWDGLHVSRDGLRVKTHSRKKEVNHGTWEMYRARLVDPERQFHLRVENVRAMPGGRAELDIQAEAALDVFGRWSRWERGVQLISVSAAADARVRLRVHCNLGLQLDPTKLPPDVILDPQVTDAALELVDFRLRRISDLHGSVVHELGKGVRDVIEHKLEEKRPRLVQKINRQIAKHPRAIRLSLHDLVASKWGGMVSEHLTAAPGRSAPAASPVPP
jgi:hypothetical protein